MSEVAMPPAWSNGVARAAIMVGAIFGSFAFPLGTGLGALGGWIAARLWLWAAARDVRRGRPIAGIQWGVLAGLVATLALHGGLWLTRGSLDDTRSGFLEVQRVVWMAGLICGVVAGAVTGALCGAVCQSRLRSGRSGSATGQESESRA